MHKRPTIQKLPEHVANQIAAGEVVERPAAVVKELVENSIDAGATQIEVAFQNGGKTYLLIEDNGHGMSAAEARLSLERHATSKLRTVEDLNRLMSFGFRGEALPSIASISEFSLATQTAECDAGIEIRFQNGMFAEEKVVHKSIGTRIEVRHLFHPVPARRKFLKTDATEGAHITQLMRLYALAYPKIAFSLKDKQRTIFDYPEASDFNERLEAFLGEDPSLQWLDLPLYEGQGKRIWGKISKPHLTRTTREDMIFWVNHRPIKSRLLGQALIEGYQSFIPQGRFPLAFLFVEIDPKLVDVNVHPTKQEVRFRDENTLRLELVQLIRHTLEEALPMLNQGITTPLKPPAPFQTIDSPQPKVETVARPTDFSVFLPPSKVDFQALPVPPYSPTAPLKTAKGLLQPPIRPPQLPEKASSKLSVPPFESPSHSLKDWHFLSHWEGSHSIFLAPKGLVILHRQRANLRIEYHQVLNTLREGRPIPHQQLLEPFPLPASLKTLLGSSFLITILEQNGFSIDNDCLKSTPLGFETSEAIDWLEKTLHTLGEETLPELFEGQWQHHLSLVLAQKRPLSRTDAASPLKLMEALLETPQPHTCPLGKKTYFEVKISAFFA